MDEEGTTATAVTTVSFRPMSYSPLKTLRFDRPFMILITDKKKMTTSSFLQKLSTRWKNSDVASSHNNICQLVDMINCCAIILLTHVDI